MHKSCGNLRLEKNKLLSLIIFTTHIVYDDTHRGRDVQWLLQYVMFFYVPVCLFSIKCLKNEYFIIIFLHIHRVQKTTNVNYHMRR